MSNQKGRTAYNAVLTVIRFNPRAIKGNLERQWMSENGRCQGYMGFKGNCFLVSNIDKSWSHNGKYTKNKQSEGRVWLFPETSS